MVSQSGPTGPGFYAECFTAVANTVRHAFPAFAAHHVFVPAFASTWGFTQGSMNSSGFNTCSKDVNTKLAHRNVAGLKMYDGITHEGLFSLPVYLRRAIDNETRIITESEPLFVF
jgi:spermidine synthase